MYDLVVNLLLGVIYGVIGLLLLQRRMEAKDMDYSLTQIPGGRVFSFKLGVYAGTLRIVRKPGCVIPWFIRHHDGWEIIFPTAYDDQEVDQFLLKNDPPLAGNSSHSKDLEIYREVVIHQNDGLACVAGQICKIP